jgi:beta-lactamase class A
MKIAEEIKNLKICLFKHKLLVIFIFITFVFLIGVSYFIGKKSTYINCDLSKFKYVNQQLGCKPPFVIDKKSYAELKKELDKYISSKKEIGEITDVSIYYRDLSDGPTLGINEYAQFSPASLLKLPLLLTYYNLENRQSGLFDRKLTPHNIKNNLLQTIPPEKSIQEDNTYSIREILKYMIKYSDNKAYYILLQYLHEIFPQTDLLKETFVDLGIVDPRNLLDDTISVKSYASIFIQLYYSSYFNKNETSEEVLKLLSDISWSEGINKGVPSEIVIAHKFGERVNFDGEIKQLHDCGIVYYPGNPYLLCVMSRGKDMQKLTSLIGEISKMVYNEVDSRKL